ncbi:NAD(P)-binding protein [Rhizobiaceae bacterium CRRU44]|uniref:NAD(P)-binding protein n=1 Tax=Ferranicluibacter rubi TaxID=2715133 RepID=A0AA43ZFS2_9HYPH|nr:NAD(P)-binding protein [Ferranicluibacter rubi]NHT77038.1 NAD(P)-binding protein [Ferranicluibacter rubi]
MASIAVIGSGISGASCARLLRDNGHSVVIYESKPRTGGLVACTEEEGNLFHRVGGHVFNSHDPRVSRWFWSLFDREAEFIFARRNAAIYIGESFIGYPIENHLYQLPKDQVSKIIPELLEVAREKKNLGNTQNFYDFLLSTFGQTLCEEYFFPYNTKIWNADLREMPMSWLAGKLPMPDLASILHANVFRADEQSMVHSTFFYPRTGGSQFIIDKIISDIEVKFEKCSSIVLGERTLVNGCRYDSVVYTGDIRDLNSIIELTELKTLSASHFPSNGTTTVLCSCDSNPYSWVYIPSIKIRSHRMIMTGNFSPSNNSVALGNGRISCTVEFVGRCTEAEVSEALSMLPFNPKAISLNYESNSYVIQASNTRSEIDKIREGLRARNVWLCGRFAEWEYYNMDAAIASAMHVADEVCARVGND